MGAATGEGECALPARLLRQVNRYTLFDVQEMAGVLGFEPRYGEIKTRCLTAWRCPNSVLCNQMIEGTFSKMVAMTGFEPVTPAL